MKEFAFDRVNYILIAIGMAVVILGFILMSGAGSSEEAFNPEIFSAMQLEKSYSKDPSSSMGLCTSRRRSEN